MGKKVCTIRESIGDTCLSSDQLINHEFRMRDATKRVEYHSLVAISFPILQHISTPKFENTQNHHNKLDLLMSASMMNSIKQSVSTKAPSPSKLMKKSLGVFKRASQESVEGEDSGFRQRRSSFTASEEDLRVDKYGFVVGDNEFETVSIFEHEIEEEISSNFRRSSLIKDKVFQATHGTDEKDRGWPKMLGLNAILTKKVGVYETLVAMSDLNQGSSHTDLLNECKISWDGIERDLKRTFPMHTLFQEPHLDDTTQVNEDETVESSQPKKEAYGMRALRRVLKAYSIYDKEIGYCQGMNFITGMMLTFLTEEETFWLLVVVMNEEPFKLREIFSKDMVGTHEILYIADKLVTSYLPELQEHFEDEQVHTSMFTTQWLMTIFSSTLPFELVSRVWDSFLAEGWNIVYRTLIALLKYAQKDGDLLNRNMEQILTYLRNFQSKVNADEILLLAEQVPLKQHHIRRHAQEFRKMVTNGEISVHEIYDHSDSISVTSSISTSNISKVHRFVIKLKRTNREINVQDLSPTLVSITGSAKFAVLLKNALSPEECVSLLKRAKGETFKHICINGSSKHETIAQFHQSIVEDIELADVLYDRVVTALEGVPGLWERFSEASWTKQKTNMPLKVTRLNSKFHFLKYGFGDFAVPLRDGSFISGVEKSYVTMQLYLNSSFKGGITSFRGTKKSYNVKTRPGSILLYDQELRHEECEVVKGRRHILRTDVMFAPHRSDYPYETTL